MDDFQQWIELLSDSYEVIKNMESLNKDVRMEQITNIFGRHLAI